MMKERFGCQQICNKLTVIRVKNWHDTHQILPLWYISRKLIRDGYFYSVSEFSEFNSTKRGKILNKLNIISKLYYISYREYSCYSFACGCYVGVVINNLISWTAWIEICVSS